MCNEIISKLLNRFLKCMKYNFSYNQLTALELFIILEIYLCKM